MTGVISIRPETRGVKQAPPLPVLVELAEGVDATEGLSDEIRKRIRDTLVVTTDVRLVPFGALPRTDYKSKLVDWSQAD